MGRSLAFHPKVHASMHTAEEMKQAMDRLLFAAYRLPAGNDRESKIAEYSAELKDLGWSQSEIRLIVDGVRWILKP
jgi:hypothetical protein